MEKLRMFIESTDGNYVNLLQVDTFDFIEGENSNEVLLVGAIGDKVRTLWEGTLLECKQFVGYLFLHMREKPFLIQTPLPETLELLGGGAGKIGSITPIPDEIRDGLAAHQRHEIEMLLKTLI